MSDLERVVERLVQRHRPSLLAYAIGKCLLAEHGAAGTRRDDRGRAQPGPAGRLPSRLAEHARAAHTDGRLARGDRLQLRSRRGPLMFESCPGQVAYVTLDLEALRRPARRAASFVVRLQQSRAQASRASGEMPHGSARVRWMPRLSSKSSARPLVVAPGQRNPTEHLGSSSRRCARSRADAPPRTLSVEKTLGRHRVRPAGAHTRTAVIGGAMPRSRDHPMCRATLESLLGEIARLGRRHP